MSGIVEIIITLVFAIIVYIFIKINRTEVSYVQSSIDNKEYLVRNLPNKQQAADLLAEIKRRLFKIKDHTLSNINNYQKYEQYIKLLNSRIKDVIITEKSENNEYTSYTVNKGEEIVFCLRSRANNDQLHNINLIMYVAIHELAHVACTEKGHTDLFKELFAFLLQVGMELNLYTYQDYSKQSEEYCGLKINESII